MKTTIELPDDLVRDLKLRAVRERRKLKDLAADLLRAGLSPAAPAKAPRQPRIVKDKLTGLPVIQCRRAAPPGCELTPDEVARILIDQEVAAYGREPAR